MKTAPVTPYLPAPADSVSAREWTTPDGKPISDRFEHWDPFTEVELFQSVDLDMGSIRDACRLGQDAAFAIVGAWYSHRTRLGEAGLPVELGTVGGLVRVPLRLVIPGSQSGGRVDLRTRVVLRHPGLAPSPISPKRVGATLWSDEVTVAFEGSSARFPVTPTDFASTPRLPDRGSWILDWDPEDLSGPVLGGLRLLVNSGDADLMGALRTGSSDSRAGALRAFLRLDIARTIVRAVLDNDEFVDSPERYDESTVGRMAFELLAMTWPGVPIKSLRVRAEEDPGRLEAELQGHLGVLA